MGATRQELGFTLMEVLVTVAVLSIVVSLALPSFRVTLQNNRRAAALNDFVVTLSHARGLAVARRVPVTVCRSNAYAATTPTCAAGSGWEDGWLTFLDVNGDGTFDSATDSVERRHEALPSDITFRGNTKVVNRVTFNNAGVTNNNGTLALCDSRGWSTANSRVVVISTGGRVQAISPDLQDDPTPVSSCTP